MGERDARDEGPRVAPLDAAALAGFLARRAVPGVEAVAGPRYARALGGRVVEVDLGALAGDAASAASGGHRVPTGAASDRAPSVAADAPAATAAAALARTLAGPDVDVLAAEAHLSGHPRLGPLVRTAPGLRVPGHPDGAELAIRAVLGQQVSVAGARTLAGRLTARLGEPLAAPPVAGPACAVTHAFPTPAALAGLDPAALPMPRARGRALVGLAAALADGRVDLAAGAEPAVARAQLLALPGIGPWTADYVLLRALRAPDVLLVGDLGVRHALAALGAGVTPAELRRLAEECRPWGSFATIHLWHALGAG